jgi:PAS domain S-box-containing protein
LGQLTENRDENSGRDSAHLHATGNSGPREIREDAARRLELAMAAGEFGMWDWDLATSQMTYSPRARAIMGFPLDGPLTFEMVRDVTHPDDLPFTHAQLGRSLDPEIRERRPYEYRIIRPDGAIRWVLAYGQAIFSEGGGTIRATRYLGTIQDITARKEMEREIGAAATRLRLALDAGRMAVWEIDSAGALKTSPELNRILGFPPDANPTIEQIRAQYYPGEQQRVQDLGRQFLAQGNSEFDVEFRYVWPDLSVHWLWVRALTSRNPETDQYSAIGLIHDVTERKEREQHFEFMLHELSHRSKNLLAVVVAMTRQTVRSAKSPEEFEKAMLGRVHALASAHDLLLKEDWRGAAISELITGQLQAFRDTDRQRIQLEGPDILLHSTAAQDLSISIYELATNALKYGALSSPDGRVEISWHIEGSGAGGRTLQICWTERGGPIVESQKRRGFGTAVLGRGGDQRGGGGSTLDFRPEGIRWARSWNEPQFSLRPSS